MNSGMAAHEAATHHTSMYVGCTVLNYQLSNVDKITDVSTGMLQSSSWQRCLSHFRPGQEWSIPVETSAGFCPHWWSRNRTTYVHTLVSGEAPSSPKYLMYTPTQYITFTYTHNTHNTGSLLFFCVGIATVRSCPWPVCFAMENIDS